MIRAFRSEAIKLRQRTYWVGAAGMVAFMAITMVISISGGREAPEDRGPAGLMLSQAQLEAADGLARSLGNSVTFLGIVAITLVAINVGSEYSLGTIRNLLVRQPHRVGLFLGKTAALLAYLAVAVAITCLAAAGLAQLLAAGDLDTSAWWSRSGLVATAGGVANLAIASWGWGAMGLLLAVVLRSAPATIGVGVAYALPFEILLGEVSGEVARWLPGQQLQALARGGTSAVDYPTTLLGTLGWLAVAVLAALVIFRTRDVGD